MYWQHRSIPTTREKILISAVAETKSSIGTNEEEDKPEEERATYAE
jgi:hypothetical protein